jgi:eukaryotic-like serine/threonine-protein kinase
VIGTTAGAYRILDVVSVGGMGTVYRAEHTLIGRTAAVKVLHPEMSSSRDIVNRFFNEAKATTSIKHPGIVEIYDFGYLESGHAYLVMEFLEGETMAARNKTRGAVSEGEAAALLRGVCSALSAAHAKGIVHRDLKPDNIFLVPDPDAPLGVRPKLLDFGIAKLTDVGLAGSATKTGAVMGTPTYMSPEQCKGTGDVDHRADLYSIGCMFYELVCNRPPFIERGAGELIGAHLFVQPDPPSRYAQGLSQESEALIMSLLAKQAAQRPQSAVELMQRFASIAQRTGFGSSTSWESRPSVANVVAQSGPSAATQFAGNHTPSGLHTPHGMPTPHGGPQTHGGYATPSYSPAPGTAPVPNYTPMISYGTGPGTQPGQPTAEKPTTLSGAASQSSGAKKSSGKWLIGAAAVVVIGGVVAIAAVMGGGDKADDTKAMTQPEDKGATDNAATDKAAADKAAADKAAADKLAADKAAADKAAADKAAADKAAADKAAADKAAADAKAVAAAKTAADAKAAADAKIAADAKAAAAKKSTTSKTTTKKTTTKKTGDLLETDL